MNLIEKLYPLMEKNNISTLHRLALNINIPYTTLASIATGKVTDIRLSTYKKICDYFHVSLNYFFNDNTTESMKEDLLFNNNIIENEKNNTVAHKDSSLKRLDVSFNKHIELEEYKKSNLLAYWINDFAEYHDNEKSFDSTTLKTFKRGDIVKANLGFNIGNELGGLHYCVVINKNDNPYSNTLNIIPLTSTKKGKTYNSTTSVNLGDELYVSLLKKFDKKRYELLKELNKMRNLDTHEKLVNTKSIIKKLDYLQKIDEEINRMKHGSIAYINQITTISKQRIFRVPILSGIKLSNHNLDLIDNKIRQLFMK